MKESIIILGSNGQIGTELAAALRKKFGKNSVITTDIKHPQQSNPEELFEEINVLDLEALRLLFDKHKPTQVYLLAALLSAIGEQKPKKAWELNMGGLLNVLDLAVEYKVNKVFWPSSIAVFGPHSPRENTPQFCIMDPNTVYGFSKLAGERWCEYYFQKYNLDVRSIRYPGLISWKAAPGGGTTDYAINIFHDALKSGHYECFLSPDTELPMLYMDDAIRGTLALMDAPAESLRIRSSYNLGGMSFTPKELSLEIQKHIPEFSISYLDGDPRQKIADSWPKSIEDDFAREDWGWEPNFDLKVTSATMLENLKKIIEHT
jgi:nucleoside-diphosphate-sugar epimerase